MKVVNSEHHFVFGTFSPVPTCKPANSSGQVGRWIELPANTGAMGVRNTSCAGHAVRDVLEAVGALYLE